VSARVLSQGELNRALLARQLLLERSPLSPTHALEQVAGLQAQERMPPFVGLWTRLHDFRAEELKAALQRRRAVKGTLMRGTLHVVSARDYRRFLPALLPTIQGMWSSYLRDRQPVGDVDELTRRALAYAAEPRTTKELRAYLGGEDQWWRVRRHGAFVHAPNDERWGFPRNPRLVAAEAWMRRPLASADAGRSHLIRRYLAAFGPASLADVSAWSGIPVAQLRPALQALPLRRFADVHGRDLFDVRNGPLPDPARPTPPRLLPAFDNLILSHRDRTRVIADDHRRIVIRGGLVDPVFLVDGFVAGRWQLADGRIELEPFERLTAATERALRREADRLVAFAA
jgi:Winged helix DNA-binding domain